MKAGAASCCGSSSPWWTPPRADPDRTCPGRDLARRPPGQLLGLRGHGGRPHFLNALQKSDPAGRVRFTTTYPGSCPGRSAHIHVKVHAGGNVVHTGQLYFPQRFNDRIYAQARYQHLAPRGPRTTEQHLNSSGGAETKLALSPPRRRWLQGRDDVAVQR